MKLLIQRVSEAEVCVSNKSVGKISRGILVLVGFEKDDADINLDKLCSKLLNYRVFPDHENKMNLNVQQVKGDILVVSQFTLAANTKKGLRPSFSSAAHPETALGLYHKFIDKLRQSELRIETGEYGADMQVSLINDGPVTFLLEG